MIVPALRKNPLTVLVVPVRVSVFAAISNRAFASMVRLDVAVIAVPAVTLAVVFEMNRKVKLTPPAEID